MPTRSLYWINKQCTDGCSAAPKIQSSRWRHRRGAGCAVPTHCRVGAGGVVVVAGRGPRPCRPPCTRTRTRWARQRQGRGHQALRKHDLPCTTKSHHVWHVKAGVRIYLSPSTRAKPEINNSPGASQSSLTRESRSGASQTYCSVNDAWGRARVSATELSRDAVPSSHEPPAILPNPRVQFLISPLSVSSLLRKQAVTYQFVRCRILLHKIQPNPQSLPPTTCSLFVRFLCSVDPTRIRSWN
jgi:hypothetical protein